MLASAKNEKKVMPTYMVLKLTHCGNKESLAIACSYLKFKTGIDGRMVVN